MATANLPDYSRGLGTGRSVAELLAARAEIDARLPDMSLKSVDVERELVIQLKTAQMLQRDTLEDESTPANQKSQVLNSASAALANLAKLQIEIYDSERLKRIEAILIEVVNTLPAKAQESFLSRYEVELGRLTHTM